MPRVDEQIYQELQQDKKLVNKYDKKQGIYAVFGQGGDLAQPVLLYIGQSRNILKRISAHMAHIKNPYTKESYQNKYKIMRKLINDGYTIKFDVLEYTFLLDEREGYWIREKQPPLNYQIPKENGKGYTINKNANTITIQEILNV